MEIRGKVAVVTGSGGDGCGRAIAARLARDGASVVVSDIDDEGGAATVARITSEGGRAIYHRADVQVGGQAAELIAAAEEAFGALDILVNNASGPEYRPDVPLEFWEATVQTELLGTIYATRHAIDAMRRRGGGAIVNVSSTSALEHGRLRPGGSPAYDAAKAGVLHLTEGLRFLAGERIFANCIVPHWIATPEVAGYVESLSMQEREERGVPDVLVALDEVSAAVATCIANESLAGRALVLWGGRDPGLIPLGDRGYIFLEPLG